MVKNFRKILLLGCVSVVALSACESSSVRQDRELRTSKIDTALERAAYNAAARGEDESSLALLERMYKRNSSDPVAAAKYASALRRSDYLNRAAIVLRPFASADDAVAAIKNEYAAIQLGLGNYSTAEEFSQQAILMEPENFRAYHHLGIALDAQGMHKEAERAFRKGLDHWQGDPTSIMNNLALNLATQGHTEEAMSILEKALSVAPKRTELQRNLRIISTLEEVNAPRRNPIVDMITPKKKPSLDEAES